MASTIFASNDIATLVANFHPVSLFENRPLIVRTISGEGLLELDKVVRQLEDLLENSQQRIEKASLSTVLGIEKDNEGLVLERLNGELYESKNGSRFIPRPEARSILEEFHKRASQACVDLLNFSSEHDISSDGLRQLIQSQESQPLRSFNDRWMCSAVVADGIKTQLRDVIGCSGTDICELPADVSQDVPSIVLKELANDIALEIGGEIRLEGDHIVYVPPNHTAAVKDRLEQARRETIKLLAEQLGDSGYCIVRLDHDTTDEVGEIADSVVEHFDKDDVDVRILTIPEGLQSIMKGSRSKQKTKLLITSEALERELDTIRSAISSYVVTAWDKGDRPSSPSSLLKSLTSDTFSAPWKSDLAKLLLRSDHAKDLETAVRRQLESLEEGEHEKLIQLVRVRLVIPLQLYTTGIETIQDATLKQHLEDFLGDHFRKEVVPQMIQAAQEQQLLREKARERELDKFKQSCVDGTSFASLQIAVTKLSKKIKLETPSEEMVEKVRLKTLQTAAKSMQKMKRGSDVLQNLIWILLAQQSGGMFMSSGKDTSRMIKRYEAVGSSETAAKLVHWRDTLKAGQETRDDLQEMRNMANAVVEAMSGSGRKNSGTSISPERRKPST